MFNTKWQRTKVKIIQPEQKSKVAKEQNVPTAMRVQNMFMAGKVRQEYQKNQYDFFGNDGYDTVIEDITRKKGVDLYDIMEAQKRLSEKVNQKRLEKMRQMQEKAKEAYKQQLLEEMASKDLQTSHGGGETPLPKDKEISK